ncbi:YjjW family glycine radical enzyme activase [Tepidibacter hydrothermalis]|uniref:YjjW family glycine radical enzyme activase n=1 Tax=Tepidibacter hydrothermalis TaxID=3036126 RepID=A0ABY8E827_9FIRM|nr:YjjW family glycine radical enzyme activase [Tepidibacter hydrothermalis]WFD09001.1 YjjW family glycine radical enzyme activase [Tepidibacter hydrothermalis]
MCKGLVNRILPFSSVDGPGNRSVIFMQGCNFNCLYCHNPETINICNNCGACVKSCKYESLSNEGKEVVWDVKNCKHCDMCLKSCPNDSNPKSVYMSVDEAYEQIDKVKSFISGITVSGGECTLQHEFLTKLFVEVKKLGLTCYVDTNGSIPLKDKNEFVDIMDMGMIDLKSYDEDEHKMLTGMSNKNVIENIKYLASIDKLYEVRTVIVPDVLNNHYNVDQISKLIASLNSNIRYKIIRYRNHGVRKDIINSYTPSDDTMNELHEIASNNGCENIILV